MKTALSILLCVFVILSTNRTMAEFPIVTDLSLAKSLSESTDQPLIIIFGAKSCSHCGFLKKDIEDGYFMMQLDGKIVCYIDISRRKDLIDEYDIRSLPDSRLMVRGKQKSSIIGYDRSKYERWLSNDTIK